MYWLEFVKKSNDSHFGVESFDFVTGEGYIYEKKEGYGNMSSYMEKSELILELTLTYETL